MPRVHHVKKARKDNPVAKKGESYYWWKNRYGPKRYSKTYPRQSQLTSSDKLARIYEAVEDIQDVLDGVGNFAFDKSYVDSMIDALREAADSVTEVGEEYQESADAIRDYFVESETADEIEEKVSSCEYFVAALEEAINDIESIDFPEEYEEDGEETFEYDERVRDIVEEALSQQEL